MADNAVYDGSNTDGTVIDLPCTPDTNPRSRWIPRPDTTLANCINTLQNATISALSSALLLGVDDNPSMRDIYLWNRLAEDGCDPADELAFGMQIFVSEDEGCWENVHPDYW